MQLQLPNNAAIPLDRPRLMGILNVTPDSFSDGGRYGRVDAAVRHGLAMAEAGAVIIDVGGESTRPGAERLPVDTQCERVLPVIRELRAGLDADHPEVAISIDTTLRAVAEPAVDAGAAILNDVTAGRDDPAMFALAAERGLPIVLMHMQGTPETMQANPTYQDVVAEVRRFLLERAEAARQAGVLAERIVIDPGIGFGKTVAHNLALLAHLDQFVASGYLVLLGASRKGMIGKVSPATGTSSDQRVGGTCATTALAVAAGVRLLRVHDVRENQQAADVAWAITQARRGSADPSTTPSTDSSTK
ncbi:MAG: dihydropteroate synthase [Phycisphaeraceae bacterium]